MANQLAALDYQVLQQCMHCGMCLPTCPTYDVTGKERNSPRGRIALMRSIADQELDITREFADEMSYCLGCLACQTACPAGVNYAELFETARSDVQATLPSSASGKFWRAITLRGLFRHPRLLRFVGRLLRLYQKSGAQSAFRRLKLTHLLPANLRRLEPQTPAVSSAFSPELIATVERPSGSPPRHRVYLLTGCMQDLLFSSVNRDTADVLLAHQCEVITPAEQPCCGSIHAHNGEQEIAREMARRWLDLVDLDRCDAIISNAGGCGSHLRHFAKLLADDPTYLPRAQTWDAKLRDIHEWLVEIGFRKPNFPSGETATVSVTYHDSCHLAHGQKVTSAPREILRQIPGVNLVPLPESDWCCGSAGIYNITQPVESERLLNRKIAHIGDTQADVLATANPGCHLQIARGLQTAQPRMEVKHSITLLAEAYRAESTPSSS
jgi:glycolate oxidase iron-sulfur subunit